MGLSGLPGVRLHGVAVAIRETQRVGGRTCLDFTNSVSSWEPTGGGEAYAATGEKLVDYAALVEWLTPELGESGRRELVRRAEKAPRTASQVLRRALRLRESLYRILRSHIAGGKPDGGDLEVLSDEVRRAHRHDRLAWRREGFTVESVDAEPLELPLGLIVRSAIELLTSKELARVKACPGEHCGWLFVDTSKSGRRRWCLMSDCGNLDKVRRFRERALADA
jgi:predicted RNA-binding Zn ribbon-like protein